MDQRRALALLAVVALVAGCGGGGGGSSAPPSGGGATATPTSNALCVATPLSSGTATSAPGTGTVVNATAPPAVAAGFSTATAPIIPLSATSGAFGANLQAGSSAGQFIVQSGNSPARPGTPTSIGLYGVTVSEGAGLATQSVAPPDASAVPRLAQAHVDAAADGLHEPELHAETVRLLSLRRAPSGTAALSVARAAKANVGDQRCFKVLYSGIGGATTVCPNTSLGNYTCYVNIVATLKAVSNHGYLWVDNASLADPNEFPDPSAFATSVANFENYYGIETQTFGRAFTSGAPATNYAQCDANGNQLPTNQYLPVPDLTGIDPHINIVVTDALAGTGEGGYFYSGDLYSQQQLNCLSKPLPVSNQVPMFIVGSSKYPPTPGAPTYNPQYWVQTDFPRTASHELQHYLHAINKVFQPLVTGGTQVVDDAWVDEGCSMLAEDLAANGMQIDTPRYSYQYLLEPSQYSLTSFIGYQPNPLSGTGPYSYYAYNAGNYGAAYLMMRYVYDRFGGAAALQRLYGTFSSPPNGFANVGPVTAAANNESWQQLYGEFSIALSNQSTGISNDPRYVFASGIVLRGSVTVPSRRSAPLNVRTLVFGGPRPPDTFDASGNLTGSVQLSPGGSATITAMDGATNFFNLSQATGGANVRTSAGNLPSAQGALVQGPLPTPMPTSI